MILERTALADVVLEFLTAQPDRQVSSGTRLAVELRAAGHRFPTLELRYALEDLHRSCHVRIVRGRHGARGYRLKEVQS